MYPIDMPSQDDSELASASLQYLSSLESGSACCDRFEASTKSKLEITKHNIQRLQLFNDQPKSVLLSLHFPGAPQKVVALYLFGKWWPLNDVLRTSRRERDGLERVGSTTERALVLVLAQLLDRSPEEEQLFSLHSRTENCKLLWTHGEAVGFYSFKLKGSLCESGTGRCYELPVLDTIFVRSRCRKRGLGLRMLQDFCHMFHDEGLLGISSPLSAGMVAVCRKFLSEHKEHRDVLYEVEAPGSWTQRRNIWLNIRLGRYSNAQGNATTQADAKDQEAGQSQKIQDLEKTSTNSGYLSTSCQTPHSPKSHCGPPNEMKYKDLLPVDQDGEEEESNKQAKRPRRN